MRPVIYQTKKGDNQLTNLAVPPFPSVFWGEKGGEGDVRAPSSTIVPCLPRLRRFLGLCYTVSMPVDRRLWVSWSESLQRWGVDGIVASLIEAFGPLTVLGAQAVYLLQPLLQSSASGANLGALAQMLEEPEQAQAFAQSLREARRS